MRITTSAAALITLLGLFSEPASAQAPPYILTWGSSGGGDGQFAQNRGIAVGPNGHIYVTDYPTHSRIQEFTSSGIFVGKWGTNGTGPGKLLAPEDIAFDASGNVYVSDAGGGHINEFTSAGVYITRWGVPGSADGEFETASGIAIGPSGNVYVADRSNDRIQVFSPSGTFLFKWGTLGAGTGQFNKPYGLAIDASGFVYVSEEAGQRVQKFTPAGVYATSWQVGCPMGIDVDASGRVYVAQQGCADQVSVYDGSGTLLTQWGSTGDGPGQFRGATSVAVAPDGSIYVSDAQTYKIQKFGALPTSVTHASWGRVKQLYR